MNIKPTYWTIFFFVTFFIICCQQPQPTPQSEIEKFIKGLPKISKKNYRVAFEEMKNILKYNLADTVSYQGLVAIKEDKKHIAYMLVTYPATNDSPNDFGLGLIIHPLPYRTNIDSIVLNILGNPNEVKLNNLTNWTAPGGGIISVKTNILQYQTK